MNTAAGVGKAHRTVRKIFGLMPYLFLILILAVSMLPLIGMLGTSFRSYDTLYSTRGIFPEKWSLDFYKKVMSDARVLNYFKNSFVNASVTALSTTVIAILGGYAMARYGKKMRGIKLFTTFILMVQMFPTLQMIIPLYLTFNDMGIINKWYTLFLAYPAFTLPMSLMLMSSFIENVPHEMEEAGRIDGCNRLQVIIRLVLPISRPGIASAAILAFNHCWNEFLIALLLIKKDVYRTMTIGLHNYMQENNTDWGLIMAASVLMIIPILLFLNVLQKHIVSGLTMGAVKG
ncbi:MAG: carbohydrate ABC transporter permease [Bacillota bacterium]